MHRTRRPQNSSEHLESWKPADASRKALEARQDWVEGRQGDQFPSDFALIGNNLTGKKGFEFYQRDFKTG